MISYISGKVFKISGGKDSYVDILTNGGVAYRINIPSNYICPGVGEGYSLFTYYHVKEDGQMLYGFDNEEDKNFFKQIISVSGVGPKIGIAIMSAFSRHDLEGVIMDGDAKSLAKVPGLGLKRAQKIILELRGKVDFDVKEDSANDSLIKEFKEALKVLGFAGDALKDKVSVAEEIIAGNKEIEIEELIKISLSK